MQQITHRGLARWCGVAVRVTTTRSLAEKGASNGPNVDSQFSNPVPGLRLLLVAISLLRDETAAAAASAGPDDQASSP